MAKNYIGCLEMANDKKSYPPGATVGSVSPEFNITINGETISTMPQDNVWVSPKDIPLTYTTATTTDTITVDTGYDASHDFTFDISGYQQTEFVDTMPSVTKINEMCNDYPALKTAYEKFITVYKMCEQDYNGKKEFDDEVPF